ncbi:predicted protein [Botrytis cinerea T4]|uniref:Uncharacterized protein n=1 Tax=Botryotinia fuckeliana (strain T4) TaxID=999810 RepID=G2XWX8_BOTF4|nr:predicted protein [Botrytis cinerea T4]
MSYSDLKGCFTVVLAKSNQNLDYAILLERRRKPASVDTVEYEYTTKREYPVLKMAHRLLTR